jgi:O-antigen ligase
MVSRPGAIRWLALGLAVAGIYEGYLTIEQRFSGMFQAIGSMGHQNLLGLTLHFVTLPLIGILLAGERSKIIMFGILGALIAVGLGASRGAITFVSLGIVILFVLSLMRRATAQKWKIFGFGVLAAALFLPIAMNSFSDRFGNGPIYSQDNERVAFANAAKAMWADHPMGIGANQFVVIANTGGYYARAGVHWNPGNRGALVHNMYLLAAAETGWLGLITLLSLLLWPIVCGLRFSFAHRRDPRGDVVLGATVAIMVLAVHGLYEWVFFEVYAQYVFAISLGLIAGTIRQVRLEKARASSSAARASIPGDHVQSRPAASVSIAAK